MPDGPTLKAVAELAAVVMARSPAVAVMVVAALVVIELAAEARRRGCHEYNRVSRRQQAHTKACSLVQGGDEHFLRCRNTTGHGTRRLAYWHNSRFAHQRELSTAHPLLITLSAFTPLAEVLCSVLFYPDLSLITFPTSTSPAVVSIHR